MTFELIQNNLYARIKEFLTLFFYVFSSGGLVQAQALMEKGPVGPSHLLTAHHQLDTGCTLLLRVTPFGKTQQRPTFIPTLELDAKSTKGLL